MKKIWIMTTAALGLLVCGCSQGDSAAPETVDFAVRLRAGLTATTKAPVNNGSVFTAAVAGWESNSGSADYAVAATWQAVSEITASEASGNIALTPQPYYNQNSAVKTYVKAWYPAGTLSVDGKVAFGGTPDGTVDVLQAPQVVGSSVDMDAKALVFRHPLSQIKFKVVCNAAFGATTAIRSISIKDAGLPTGLDLTTDAVIYAAPASVSVSGIDGSQLIAVSAERTGDPVMVMPFAGKTCKIDVETSVTTYTDVTVTIDNDASFIPGKAYTVTLNFAGLGISTSASVTPWDDTGTGSGDITVNNRK